MNTFRMSGKLALVAGMMAVGGLQQALAAGTAAGTPVNNTATVNYAVGTVTQTPVQSNGGTPTTFVVDRKVDVTVTHANAPVIVVPGAVKQALTFTVTNHSNATLTFALTAVDAVLGATVLTSPNRLDSDDVAATPAITMYSDAGLTNVITSLASLAPDTPTTVYVAADIKTSSLHDAYIGISLTANAFELDGVTEVVATPGANTAGVDTVLADTAGVAGDAAYNGAHSAYGAYHVETAALTVTKTATVVWDPIGGTTNPKSIPGAIVGYCLVVTNSGGAAATNVVLRDVIPANTAYYAVTEVAPAGAPVAAVTTGTGATCGSNAHGTSQGAYVVPVLPALPNVTSTYTDPIAVSGSVWTQFYVKVQ
jgi:uncharacterized repeat protein (TIGR01451 family)